MASGRASGKRMESSWPQVIHSICRAQRVSFPRFSGVRPQAWDGRRHELNQDQVWSQVQEELRFQLAKRTYDMWLKNTSVLSADNNTYRIGVPSKLAKDWLADRFSGLLQETLQAVTGTEVDIDFVISPTGHRPAIANVDVDTLSPTSDNGRDNGAEPYADAPTIPPSELNVRFKFSSFVVGHNSQFAHAAAKA